jgi:hypothetical protein
MQLLDAAWWEQMHPFFFTERIQFFPVSVNNNNNNSIINYVNVVSLVSTSVGLVYQLVNIYICGSWYCVSF